MKESRAKKHKVEKGRSRELGDTSSEESEIESDGWYREWVK